MQIDIQTLGFTLTDALREHTRSRLGFALGHQIERQRASRASVPEPTSSPES